MNNSHEKLWPKGSVKATKPQKAKPLPKKVTGRRAAAKRTAKLVRIVFSDAKPTEPGYYFYRTDKRETKANSWVVATISRGKKGLMCTISGRVPLVRELLSGIKGQFSTTRFE